MAAPLHTFLDAQMSKQDTLASVTRVLRQHQSLVPFQMAATQLAILLPATSHSTT